MAKPKNIVALFILVLFFALGGNYLIKKNFASPCQKPIAYSIGEIDPRFNLSKDNLVKFLKQAEEVWEIPTGIDLFTYSETGKLKISLVYDSRQESTNKLQQLGISINEDQKTYSSLKTQYNSLVTDYSAQKQALNNLINNYNAAKTEYDKEVNSWNKKGGAPKKEYDQLNQEKTRLLNLVSQIQSLQADLNKVVDTINATANVLNRLATALNLNVDKYNNIGLSQETEFQEGVYKKDWSGEEIIVYQFDNYTKLVRVLAHEFGHALGLKHFNNPEAIMYSVNQGDSLNLSAPEISTIKTMCHMP